MEFNEIKISGFYFPLFWIKGIPTIDLLMMDTYTTSCFNDLQATFDYYIQVIDEKNFTTPALNMAKLNYLINQASVEMYYCSYLLILTHLPQSTQEKFYQLSPEWINLPKTGLGLPDKEYERLVNAAAEAVNEQIEMQKHITKQEDPEIDAMQEKIDDLERKGEEIDSLLNIIR